MVLSKLWIKVSRGRRLNIKRVILIPVIVYATYVFIDSFVHMSIVVFLFWFFYNWTAKKRLYWWIYKTHGNEKVKIIFLIAILCGLTFPSVLITFAVWLDGYADYLYSLVKKEKTFIPYWVKKLSNNYFYFFCG